MVKEEHQQSRERGTPVHACYGAKQTLPWGEGEAEGGGPARGPLAQVAMVCSVWGTTLSSRRTLFSSTASCGSTVSRPGPVDAMAAFQRHLLGEDLHGRAPRTDCSHIAAGGQPEMSNSVLSCADLSAA